MSKRPSRASTYQWRIIEMNASSELIQFAQIARNDFAPAASDILSEDLKEIDDLIKDQFWIMIDTHCTDRQKQVLNLLREGHTQVIVAKMLNVNQSSINKSIMGFRPYPTKDKQQCFGGIKKKIFKIMLENETLKLLCVKANEDVPELVSMPYFGLVRGMFASFRDFENWLYPPPPEPEE